MKVISAMEKYSVETRGFVSWFLEEGQTTILMRPSYVGILKVMILQDLKQATIFTNYIT